MLTARVQYYLITWYRVRCTNVWQIDIDAYYLCTICIYVYIFQSKQFGIFHFGLSVIMRVHADRVLRHRSRGRKIFRCQLGKWYRTTIAPDRKTIILKCRTAKPVVPKSPDYTHTLIYIIYIYNGTLK